MLLDTIAIVILAGMMLIPVVNIFAGVIVGAGLGGVVGAFAGLLLALIIMAAERLFVAWLADYERKREARRAAVAHAARHVPARRPVAARPTKPQPAELVPEPILADYLLDAPLFVGGVGRTPPSSASLSI